MMTKESGITSFPGCLRSLFLIMVLVFLTFGAIHPSPAVAQSARKQVLYINSYHQGYKFSDDITRALSETFAEQGNIDLRIEYLDTKRVSSPEYLEQVRLLYQNKYKGAKLDLIISSDDAALNFLFKNVNTLFPNVPVVFVGANFFDVNRLQGYEQFTGISEEADISGTLEVALSLQSGINKVVVVNDTSVTGQNVRKIFDEVMPQYPKITFEFLETVSMDEVRQRVSTLSPDTLVLLTFFFTDSNGAFYEYNQFTSLIAESSSVPVYGAWDFSLGYGIVGGKLTSGYAEGRRAAKVAIRVLNGEDPRDIPVEKRTQAQYMFDYKVLKKWNIDTSQLPDESIIIDRPVSFYEQNAAIIWVVIAGFIVLLFVIVFLVINNNQRRIAQHKLAISNKELQGFQITLEKRVEERTRALSTVAEISTASSMILNIDILLQAVVDLTKERFNLYHSHIYLLDETGENLVLAAGAGEVGRIMVAEKRFIALSSEQSLVARAARERQGVTVNDVTQAIDFLSNPLLPETRSELAVPMIVGDNVIGVFDIQSEQIGRFSDADIAVQSTLAAQVSTFIQNVRQFEQSKQKADLESLANVIGQKIQRTGSIEEALQTAVREVGLALAANRVHAKIGLDDVVSPAESREN